MACKLYLIFGFTFLLLRLSNCVGAKREVVGFSKVNADVDNFRCKMPQPRAFRVQEISKDEYTYEPTFVVLHRCSRSGCCEKVSERCLVSKKKSILLEVNVAIGRVYKPIKLKASNHTECTCVDPYIPIK